MLWHSLLYYLYLSHIALGPQVPDNEAKLDICMPYKQYDCSDKYLPYRAPFWGKKIRYLFGCEWNDLGKNIALHRFSHNTLYFSFKICAWNEILSSLHPIPPPPPHLHHNAHPQKQTRMTVVKNMLLLLLQTRNPWYGLGLSFGLANAKNCSKLRTVKTPDHDRLLTVASNLKACLTTELAIDWSLTDETLLTPPLVN